MENYEILRPERIHHRICCIEELLLYTYIRAYGNEEGVTGKCGDNVECTDYRRS